MNTVIKIAAALALIAIFISAMMRDNSVAPHKSESEFVKTWPTPSRPVPHSDEWAKQKWGKK